jgi:hypothetical protein
VMPELASRSATGLSEFSEMSAMRVVSKDHDLYKGLPAFAS